MFDRLRSNASARNLIAELERLVPTLLAEKNVPGLALSLLRDGTPYWHGAFGVRRSDTREPVTVDTVFEAASLSKPVFAYGVLRLRSEGVLDLDAPLDECMPEPYVPEDERAKMITARHVLSHTTGFPNWRSDERPLQTYYPPGERFSYSGEGYVYLQKAVTRISGQPIVDFLASRVLKPLGMTASTFVWPSDGAFEVALPHEAQGGPKEKEMWPKVNTAAGLHCTARDFASLLLAIMCPGDSAARLSFAAVGEMLRSQIPVNDLPPGAEGWPDGTCASNPHLSWGLGWGIQHASKGDAFWHWGDNGGYRAFAIGSLGPKHGLVALTNGANGQRVIDGVLRGIIGGDYPALDWLDDLYRA